MAISKTLILVGLAFAFVMLIASEVSARELAQENEEVKVDNLDEKDGGYGHGGHGGHGGRGGYGGRGGHGGNGGYGGGRGGYGGGRGGYGGGRGGYHKRPGHGRYPPVAAGETQETGN